MVQAVDRRLLTSVAREQCQADPRDIYGGQSSNGARFSPSTSVNLCLHQCTNVQHSSSSTRCCSQKDKRVRPGNLPKRNALSEIGEHWLGKKFHFCRR